MDDETLRRQLELRGQTVGPIVDSTRELYEKILLRLLDEEEVRESEASERLAVGGRDGGDVTSGDTTRSTTATPMTTPMTTTTTTTNTRRSLYLFIASLIICIVFAYFIKHYNF